MKKLLLSLLVLFACAGMVSAKQVTYDFVNETYGLTRCTQNSDPYIDSDTDVKNGDAVINLRKTAGKNGFRLWSDGLRFYKSSGAAMVISVPGGVMTKVEVTLVSGAQFELNSVSTGSYSEVNSVGTWTGSAEEMRLEYKASANKAVKTVVITYEKDGEVTPDPEPEPEPEKVAANLAEFLKLTPEKDDVATMNGDLTVVYANGSYVYVKDATASSLIYKNGLGYEAGDVIPGGWEGKNGIYNGLYEIVPTGTMPAATGKVDVTYPVHTTAVTESMVNQVVDLKNVTFDAATPSTKTNFNISFAGATYQFRNTFTLASVSADTYDVVAAIALNTYNNVTSIQIYPIEYKLVGEAKEKVEAPVFSVAGGRVEVGTELTITTATEGADIFYTLDGTTPNDESLIYISPLTIDKDMTIKAIAVMDGMYDSDVVTVDYKVIREGEKSATFNFTDVTSLTPSFDPESEDAKADNDNKYFDIADVALTSADVTFMASYIDESDTGTSPRLYIRSNDQQFRIYKKSQFTVSVPEGSNWARLW